MVNNSFYRHLLVVLSSLAIVVFVGWRLNFILYKPYNIWDIAFFRLSETDDIITHNYSSPSFIFSPQKQIRTKYHYVTGYADPFLFQDKDYVYLFYEKEYYKANGVICAFRSSDLEHWEDLGVVLHEDIHLSFPNVFRYEGNYYMIPETHQNMTVTIYRAENFPYSWKKEKDLLVSNYYVDSSIISRDGEWFLFSTTWHCEDDGLRIFVSDSLLGDYHELQYSPVSVSNSNMRCGGTIFDYKGMLYRPAQYDVNYYGEGLCLYEIDSLSSSSYSEEYVLNMINHNYDWSSKGGHHFNTIEFNGERLVVMDGRVKDNWINNRTRKLFEIFNGSQND